MEKFQLAQEAPVAETVGTVMNPEVYKKKLYSPP